ESWVDAFGYACGRVGDDDSLKWLLSGPLANEWKKQPARPLVCVVPPIENGADNAGKRITAAEVRRRIWWNLLLAAPAGFSYAADGIGNWQTTVDKKPGERDWPVWQKSLFLPGAKRIGDLAGFFSTMEFWRLRPAPRDVAIQPG